MKLKFLVAMCSIGLLGFSQPAKYNKEQLQLLSLELLDQLDCNGINSDLEVSYNWQGTKITKDSIPFVMTDVSAQLQEQNMFNLSNQMARQYLMYYGNNKLLEKYTLINRLRLAVNFDYMGLIDSTGYYLQSIDNKALVKVPPEISEEYLNTKAHYLSEKGKFTEALVTYFKLVDAYTEEDDLENLAITHYNMASLFIKLKDYNRAKLYLLKVEAQLKNFEPSQTTYALYNSLGIIYKNTDSLARAFTYYQKGLELARQNNETMLLARYYSNIANVTKRQKKFDVTLRYIDSALAICNTNQIKVGVDINTINYADVLSLQGLYKEAKQRLQQLNEADLKYGNFEVWLEYLQVMHRVQNGLNNAAAELAYLRQYQKLKDSIFSSQAKDNVYEAELEGIEAIKNNEIINLNLKLENLELKKQRYTLMVFLLALLLVILMLSIFYYKRQNKIKIQLEADKAQLQRLELSSKNRQLTSMSLKNAQLSELKIKIKKALQELSKNCDTKQQDLLQPIYQILESQNYLFNWTEFDYHFNEVDRQFYKRLSAIATTLTMNDKRLCGLIKLNLSDKEIANITNKSDRTIANRKSIIKQKLGIEAHISLSDFLIKL